MVLFLWILWWVCVHSCQCLCGRGFVIDSAFCSRSGSYTHEWRKWVPLLALGPRDRLEPGDSPVCSVILALPSCSQLCPPYPQSLRILHRTLPSSFGPLLGVPFLALGQSKAQRELGICLGLPSLSYVPLSGVFVTCGQPRPGSRWSSSRRGIRISEAAWCHIRVPPSFTSLCLITEASSFTSAPHGGRACHDKILWEGTRSLNLHDGISFSSVYFIISFCHPSLTVLNLQMKLDHQYVFRKKQSMSGPVLSVASGIHGGSWNRSSAGEWALLSSPQETGNTVFSLIPSISALTQC